MSDDVWDVVIGVALIVAGAAVLRIVAVHRSRNS